MVLPFAGVPVVLGPEGLRVEPGAVPERPGATVPAEGLVAAGGRVATGAPGAFRTPGLGATPAAGSPGLTAGLLAPDLARRPGVLIAGRERRLFRGADVADRAPSGGEVADWLAASRESRGLTLPTSGSGTPGSRPSPRAPASSATSHRAVNAATAPATSRSARALRPSSETNTGAPNESASMPDGWARGCSYAVCAEAAESMTTAITRPGTKRFTR